jgi:hypothetical protein
MVREVRRWPVMAAASLGVEEEKRRRWKRAKTKDREMVERRRCVLYMTCSGQTQVKAQEQPTGQGRNI